MKSFLFMLLLTPLMFAPGNYEDLGLKSILIGTCISLAGAVFWLYKSKDSAVDKIREQSRIDLKEKDDTILEIIREHQADLKEDVSDMKTLVNNYHNLTDKLIRVVDGQRK